MQTINERLVAIDVASREILRRYDSGETRLTSSPYAHACWDAQFDGRLPCSSGLVLVDRQFIVDGRGHGDRAFRRRIWREGGRCTELWVEAARACCGVAKGQARYFIKRYPAEVAAIIRHLYPNNKKAVSFIAMPPRRYTSQVDTTAMSRERVGGPLVAVVEGAVSMKYIGGQNAKSIRGEIVC